MAGNVVEWCNDWYDTSYYNVLLSTNPMGPSAGRNKIMRGGWYDGYPETTRCAFRSSMHPEANEVSQNGFRCAKDAE